MSDCAKPLGRACLMLMFATALVSGNPSHETESKVYGAGQSVHRADVDRVKNPATVDQGTLTCILSQFRKGAYDSLTGSRVNNGGETPKNVVAPKENAVSILPAPPVAAMHNRRSSHADTVVGPLRAVASFDTIHSQDVHELHRKSVEEFTLTAYALSLHSTGKRPGSPDFGITYSGTRAKVGRTVAVDPHVIPIGTLLYIDGIGVRLAEDIGGGIKGRHIDVLMKTDTAAYQFGVKRHVHVYTIFK